MQPTPVALLHRWYCHVREKRAARQDFLKSLVKVFQENGTLESSQVVRRFSLLATIWILCRMMSVTRGIWRRISLPSSTRHWKKFSLSSDISPIFFPPLACSYWRLCRHLICWLIYIQNRMFLWTQWSPRYRYILNFCLLGYYLDM